jgi:exodeoxyribonuclease VII small subunit
MPLSPKADKGTPARLAEPKSFEAAYRELQEVVAQLEDGSLDLDRALQLFERGSQLVTACERIVDEAELRVTRLSAESASPLADVPSTTP